jgi:hypothetical protein
MSCGDAALFWRRLPARFFRPDFFFYRSRFSAIRDGFIHDLTDMQEF